MHVALLGPLGSILNTIGPIYIGSWDTVYMTNDHARGRTLDHGTQYIHDHARGRTLDHGTQYIHDHVRGRTLDHGTQYT